MAPGTLTRGGGGLRSNRDKKGQALCSADDDASEPEEQTEIILLRAYNEEGMRQFERMDKLEEMMSSIQDMLESMHSAIMEMSRRGEKRSQLQSRDKEEKTNEDEEKTNKSKKRVEGEEDDAGNTSSAGNKPPPSTPYSSGLVAAARLAAY